MEKRNLLRIPVYIEADIIAGGVSYPGFIGNLSENGIYAEIAPTNTATDFTPGTTLDVEFQHPSGEELDLLCEVTWLYTKKKSPQGLINSIGLEIIDAPLKFKDFLKTLH